MATFDARKAIELANLALDADADADRSRAGRVDARCVEFVREVCASEDFFTTSSCSGRVSVFADRGAREVERGLKGGRWVYVSHDPARGRAVVEAVREVEAETASPGETDGEDEDAATKTLVLRFEPFILAVEARDLESGADFVRCARDCGYRESGITACEKRVICAARCQIRMEAPVVVNGERMVDDAGIERLVEMANEKFRANAERMERFREAFGKMCAERASGKRGVAAESSAAHVLKCVEVRKSVAKEVKDALKKCGWLDNTRQASTKKNEDGYIEFVLLPVKTSAEELFSSRADAHAAAMADARSAKSTSPSAAIVLRAIERGEMTLRDDRGPENGGLLLSPVKKTQNPVTRLKREVTALLLANGLNENLAQEVPSRWEKLGDLVLIPENAFTANDFKIIDTELYATVARVLDAKRVARQAPVSQGPKRESRAQILYPEGADGWVETKELGVTYGLDVTKVMFSSGNGTEKNRMGNANARGETIVDLFAGIGYYTLQLLKNAHAAKVYACEWNPNSCEALRHNLRVNGVESRCDVLEGDNRRTAPVGVADRVLLGLLPHAEMSWETALKALKPEGGILHVHSNVNSGEEEEWMNRLVNELKSYAAANGRDDLEIAVEHLERVKWYGPRIRHVVCDVRCTGRAQTGEPIEREPELEEPVPLVSTREKPRQADSGVQRVHRPSPEYFTQNIAARRAPAVLTGLDIGQAPWKWTPEYLSTLDGVSEKLVSVHVSEDPKLDFVRKNFKYEVMPFGDLLGKVTDARSGKFFYLRSIGENPRKEPAHALNQFPSFKQDLTLPSAFWGAEDNYFSAIIRVSSGDLQLWTHYDAMDNMLIQLHGEKRVLLFPPSFAGDLYLEGSSSTVRDVDAHDHTVFPRFARARRAALEVILQPGDVLFIPALWAHHVTALHGPSIALNVFYRHLNASEYPAKDLYGNADPIVAAQALKSVESAMESLKGLPQDYKVFYGGIAAARLENYLGVDAARRRLSADENDASSSSRAYFGTASNETGVRALKAVIAVGVIVTGLNLWIARDRPLFVTYY